LMLAAARERVQEQGDEKSATTADWTANLRDA